MKLPNSELAEVPREKIVDYLLSPVHPIGRFKGAFFRTLGFSDTQPEVFEAAIKQLLLGPAEERSTTNYGTKYVVRGRITGPNGRDATIAAVWIILLGDPIPRFVTAYPEKEL